MSKFRCTVCFWRTSSAHQAEQHQRRSGHELVEVEEEVSGER